MDHQQHDPSTYLHQSAFILLHQDYLDTLEKEGKSVGTIQTYNLVSRQFLEYLEERKVRNLAEVRGNEISSFIPIYFKTLPAKQYENGLIGISALSSDLLRARTLPNFALAMPSPVVLEE